MITRAQIRRQLRKEGGIMNAIGGGTIQGTPMGSRTGYWNPFKAGILPEFILLLVFYK